MHQSPKISVIIPTYQRPRNLLCTLASLDAQKGCPSFEVVVADDGSNDETYEIVRRHANQAAYRVAWVSHPHEGFQAARCRNEGVLASTGEYLIFVDGDCIVPPQYVLGHWCRRREGIVLSGDVIRLSRQESDRVTVDMIRAGLSGRLVSAREYWWLQWRYAKSVVYHMIRHPKKPRLFSGASSMHRSDYERVNGYDENYRGWGLEDDDLRERLMRQGVHVCRTPASLAPIHLWHPPTDCTPPKGSGGANFDYFQRRGKLSRCVHGLRKRRPSEIRVRLSGWDRRRDLLCMLPDGYHYLENDTTSRVDLEVALFPARFRVPSGADCRILIVLESNASIPSRLARQADYIIVPGQTNSAANPGGDVRAQIAAALAKACGFEHAAQSPAEGGRARAA